MFSIFRLRKTRGPVELAADMVGVRLGERLLYVGSGLPRLFAVLAGKSGLTGRACAVVPDAGAGQTLEAAAAAEGVFAEVLVSPGAWPFDDGSFDVGVVDGTLLLGPHALPAISELRRCLRPGARAMAILGRRRGLGLRLGFEARREASVEARTLEQLLRDQQFAPVRLLAEREGLTFVEGFRGPATGA